MFTLIECEACGRSIGAGRLTCPKCGAGQSVHTRITEVWENVEHSVEKFFPIRKEIDRILEFGERVSQFSIGDIFIEIQYTDVTSFMNKALHYNRYGDKWSRSTNWRIWFMECSDRYRFIGREDKESPYIHIFEVERWLIQAFRDEEEARAIDKKEKLEIAIRKRKLEKQQKKLEEEKKSEERRELKRVADIKNRKELATKKRLLKTMCKELDDAYKKDKYGKYRKPLGLIPDGMKIKRFIKIKKTIKESNL